MSEANLEERPEDTVRRLAKRVIQLEAEAEIARRKFDKQENACAILQSAFSIAQTINEQQIRGLRRNLHEQEFDAPAPTTEAADG